MKTLLLSSFLSLLFGIQISIAQCGLLFTTSSTLTVACNGDCTAAITLSSAVTGGSGNYSYLWSPSGETTVFVTGQCAGTVTLTITDIINGCDTVVTFIVTEPNPITPSLYPITSCNGECTGAALLVANGGAGGGPGMPYNYVWTNVTTATTTSGTMDSLLTFTGLCPGNYTVELTDPLGCTGSGSVTVTEATALVANITLSTNATCFDLCDGFTNGTASGGISPYTFAWDDPGSTTNANAIGLCGSNTGINYLFTVTDSMGCEATDNVNITEPDQLILTMSSQDPSSPGFCDGVAIASITGGTTSYVLSWNIPSMPTGTTAWNLCPGVYSVTVTDANGCTVTDSVEIGIGVGFADEADPIDLVLYPNPTEGIFWISRNDQNSENLIIKVYHINGRQVHELTMSKSQREIDLSHLGKGLYFLQIVGDNAITTKKVIVQ